MVNAIWHGVETLDRWELDAVIRMIRDQTEQRTTTHHAGKQPRSPPTARDGNVCPLALHINFQLRCRGYPDITVEYFFERVLL